MQIVDVDKGIPLVAVKQKKPSDYVVVFLSHIRRDMIRDYRCFNCGRIVFQYSSAVRAIKDGVDVPEDSNPTDIQCNRCKIKYRVV